MCGDVGDAVLVDRDVAARRPRRRRHRARGRRCWGSSRCRAACATPPTDRPSSHRTVMPPSSPRSMPTARAPLSSLTPRRRNSSSRAAATSGSLVGQHLLAAHDQGDLAPERAEHVHELDAGDARADHDEVLGHLGRRVGVAGGEHPPAVGLGEARGSAAGCPSRSRMASASSSSMPSAVSTTTSCGPLSRAEPSSRRTPWSARRSTTWPCSRPVISLDPAAQQVEIDRRCLRGEAHALDAAAEGHRPAGGDHRLGRDAVPQVGGAADHVALDQGDLGAEPGGVGGGGVAGRTSADDHEPCRHRGNGSDRRAGPDPAGRAGQSSRWCQCPCNETTPPK